MKEFLLGIVLFIGGLFGIHHTQTTPTPVPVTPSVVTSPVATNPVAVEAAPTFGGFAPAGGTTYYLQSSIGLTNTTITLSSFKNRTNIPLTMTLLNTDIGYATIDPQSNISEFVSFTGITQNANGSATLTGVTRGLSDIYPFTASTTMRQPHAGQARFILSDPPQLFNEYPAKRNTEFISGAWGFQGTAPTSTTCATVFELCNKGYVDSTANAGAATSTETNGGIVELGTLGEQASSYDGGANKPTVLQTKNSTSTCQVVGSYNIVASSTTGKLDPNCIGGTTGGTYTFATTTTTNATITNATTTRLWVTGITSSMLKANSNGQVTYAATGTDFARGGYFYVNTSGATVGTDSTTATSTAYTIPAGVLTASSTIDIFAHVSATATAGGTSSCTVSLRKSIGTILSTGVFSPAASSINGGPLHYQILPNFSMSSQNIIALGALPVFAGTGFAADFSVITPSTLDYTQALTLVMVVRSGASNTNACTVDYFTIRVSLD